MENKRTRRKIFCDYKDNLSCIKEIIKYQEQLYNKVYRDGKWIRRRKNVKLQKKYVLNVLNIA